MSDLGKLPTVLDYVPCEACLAIPSPEQELLCSVCRRLDRTIGVKLVTRTSVLVERPEPVVPMQQVAILPAPQAQPVPPMPEGPLPVEVVARRKGGLFGGSKPAGSAIEIVVEPYEDVPPPVVAVPMQATPAPAPEPEPEPQWDEVASFESGASAEPQEPEPDFDSFSYERPEPEAAPPAREEPKDDFVFTPPASTYEVPPLTEEPPAPEPEIEWMPAEEIALEPPSEEPNPWARPQPQEEILLEPEPVQDASPQAEVETLLETEIEPDTEPSLSTPARRAESDEEILEMEVVEEPAAPVSPTEDEPLEMEILDETETTPSDDSDLWRLDRFDAPARAAMREAGIDALAHLSGHDPHDLAARTGINVDVLAGWVHVADLAHEAGVPIDHAKALVAAGIQGPRGLANTDAAEATRRVQALGHEVSEREVKRWKRRV